MARPGRYGRLWRGAPLAAMLCVVACAPSVSTHGQRLDMAALARIEPGNSSQRDVQQIMGSPSVLATFDDRIWYYISQRTERHSFYYATVVSQEVVAIEFDDQGTVSAVNRNGLESAVDVDPVDRETPTAGNELTIIEQFLGNIGRFNPPAEDE